MKGLDLRASCKQMHNRAHVSALASLRQLLVICCQPTGVAGPRIYRPRLPNHMLRGRFRPTAQTSTPKWRMRVAARQRFEDAGSGRLRKQKRLDVVRQEHWARIRWAQGVGSGRGQHVARF